MATIFSLHLYPIKSCRGIDLVEARFGAKGLEANGLGDRQWVVSDVDGMTVTQRECPRLALVAPRACSGGMTVSAPGMTDLPVLIEGKPRGGDIRVSIWQDSVNAVDEGDAIASWFTAFLGFPARLARFDENEKRASDTGHSGGIEALNRFSDGYPILLISRASLADLNERWTGDGHHSLPMNRFRPNIVIDGIGPYEEDQLASLACADFELRPVKACPRCSIPSVDQSSGEPGPAPIEKLAAYRFDPKLQGVVFGQNAVIGRGAGSVVRVGQVLTECWKF